MLQAHAAHTAKNLGVVINKENQKCSSYLHMPWKAHLFSQAFSIFFIIAYIDFLTFVLLTSICVYSGLNLRIFRLLKSVLQRKYIIMIIMASILLPYSTDFYSTTQDVFFFRTFLATESATASYKSSF